MGCRGLVRLVLTLLGIASGGLTYAYQADTSVAVMSLLAGYDLKAYLQGQVLKTEALRSIRWSGRVYVEFRINNDRKVNHVRILKPLDDDADMLAQKIVQTLPQWAHPVGAYRRFVVPICFEYTEPSDNMETAVPKQEDRVYVCSFPNSKTTEIIPPRLASSWRDFYYHNIRLPSEVLDGKISGMVLMRFRVSKQGKAHRFRIVQGLSKACNHEATRLVKGLPDFIPAQKGGQPVVYMDSIWIPFWKPE